MIFAEGHAPHAVLTALSLDRAEEAQRGYPDHGAHVRVIARDGAGVGVLVLHWGLSGLGHATVGAICVCRQGELSGRPRFT